MQLGIPHPPITWKGTYQGWDEASKLCYYSKLTQIANFYHSKLRCIFFVKAFCLVLQWRSLLLLFFQLDSFSLHPYTIWRRFWLRKIQTTGERRLFCFCLWQWRNSLRWKNGCLRPDESLTLAIQEDLRGFSFVKTFAQLCSNIHTGKKTVAARLWARLSVDTYIPSSPDSACIFDTVVNCLCVVPMYIYVYVYASFGY